MLNSVHIVCKKKKKKKKRRKDTTYGKINRRVLEITCAIVRATYFHNYFTKNLNMIEIRDYIFSKDTQQSNVYHKVIHGDEAAKFIRDSSYQAFLKQIVVEYTEMRVDKKNYDYKANFYI